MNTSPSSNILSAERSKCSVKAIKSKARIDATSLHSRKKCLSINNIGVFKQAAMYNVAHHLIIYDAYDAKP